MNKTIATTTACATLLWISVVHALPTAQQSCDSARVTAWKVYTSCIDRALAKSYSDYGFDPSPPFRSCRHTYFRQWARFQGKASLAGSVCRGARFSDNGDGTVTDNLTTLVWEKKTNYDSSMNYADPNDGNNTYTSSAGPPYEENGTAFTGFLAGLNAGGGFAGSNGWRLPTVAEIQTILLDFTCRGGCVCPSFPCVDPALDAVNTPGGLTKSATTYVPNVEGAWIVDFGGGFVRAILKTTSSFARAVRGGL
jgi:hypothetical protein